MCSCRRIRFDVMPVNSERRLLQRPQKRGGILVLVSVKSGSRLRSNTNTYHEHESDLSQYDHVFSPTHEHVTTRVGRSLTSLSSAPYKQLTQF